MKKVFMLAVILMMAITTTLSSTPQITSAAFEVQEGTEISNNEVSPEIENDVYSEVEKSVYDTLSEEEVELLETFENDEKVQTAVLENYHYDENGKITLKVYDMKIFSEKTELDLETSDKYIDSVNKVLDIVNEKSQTAQSVDQNEVTPMSNTRCDYTKEILASFTYESNYCRASTEQILDNISRNTYILGGIALAGFWNPYVSISSGIGSIFSSVRYDTINGYFRDSNYTGVINRVVKVPMSPDGSYWRPLGTAWDGSNPNP